MDSLLQKNSFPPWLKKTIKESREFKETKAILADLKLNTVCQSARCPNIYDCFSQKKATFLILGEHCTRECRFCAVPSKEFNIDLEPDIQPTRLNKRLNKPLFNRVGWTGYGLEEPDPEEPNSIKKAVFALGLTHIVITSVTRDDLEDGGATHFANCIKSLRSLPKIIIEVLVPDFKADSESIRKVLYVEPDIFSHNIETVPRLYPIVRPQADYARSLSVLKTARSFNNRIVLKSGIMVGLGEGPDEVIEVMEALRGAGCDIITIGQYLRPGYKNLEVQEFIEPSQFEKYSEIAKKIGFTRVASGPFVRSSMST